MKSLELSELLGLNHKKTWLKVLPNRMLKKSSWFLMMIISNRVSLFILTLFSRIDKRIRIRFRDLNFLFGLSKAQCIIWISWEYLNLRKSTQGIHSSQFYVRYCSKKNQSYRIVKFYLIESRLKILDNFFLNKRGDLFHTNQCKSLKITDHSNWVIFIQPLPESVWSYKPFKIYV